MGTLKFDKGLFELSLTKLRNSQNRIEQQISIRESITSSLKEIKRLDQEVYFQKRSKEDGKELSAFWDSVKRRTKLIVGYEFLHTKNFDYCPIDFENMK